MKVRRRSYSPREKRKSRASLYMTYLKKTSRQKSAGKYSFSSFSILWKKKSLSRCLSSDETSFLSSVLRRSMWAWKRSMFTRMSRYSVFCFSESNLPAMLSSWFWFSRSAKRYISTWSSSRLRRKSTKNSFIACSWLPDNSLDGSRARLSGGPLFRSWLTMPIPFATVLAGFLDSSCWKMGSGGTVESYAGYTSTSETN